MQRSASILALLGVFALACTEYQVYEDDGGIKDLDDNKVPDIVLDPGEIDFGDVEVMDEIEHVEVVTVSNQGEADLDILNIELQDPGAPFTISAIQSVMVPEGQSTTFEVIYDPTTAVIDDTYVDVASNDPDEPIAQVHLLGQGIAPVIEVTPTSYDFGTIFVGCENELELTVSNTGNADLVVDDFSSNPGSSDLLFGGIEDMNGADEGLMTLSPAASEFIYVSYLPLDEYADIAYLIIDSNDPFSPQVQVDQGGNGVFYGTNLDVFEQPIQAASDIIFAVDRSGSMNDDIANVITNFGVFVTTMVNMDSDFQVAATVEPTGCINGSDIWIDATFTESEAEDTINAMINLGGSYDGSTTEKAFTLLEACLSEIGAGGCNEGLVRDSAKLNLIGVSDEPEQSLNSWSYYVKLFQSYKDDPDDLVIHAVGGDYPSGCGSASAYTGMYEASVATGGQFLSICATDWATHLTALAEAAAATLDTFQLTADAVPETIVVRVDGVTSTLGWEYEGSQNAIVFETDYIPEGGATIEVEYALMGDCDA
jgi:hypothetical protein